MDTVYHLISRGNHSLVRGQANLGELFTTSFRGGITVEKRAREAHEQLFTTSFRGGITV